MANSSAQRREERRETYRQKLLDPRWQKRRLEIFERDHWACQNCGNRRATLHIHHRWYERGAEPWEASDDALVTLCERCHKSESVPPLAQMPTTVRARIKAYLVRIGSSGRAPALLIRVSINALGLRRA